MLRLRVFSFFHSIHSLSSVIQPIIYPWPEKKCLLSKIDWYCTTPLSGVHGRATRQHSSVPALSRTSLELTPRSSLLHYKPASNVLTALRNYQKS